MSIVFGGACLALVGCDGGGDFQSPDSMDFLGSESDVYQERVLENQNVPVIRFEPKLSGGGFVYRIQEQEYNEKEILDHVRRLLQTTPELEVHLVPGVLVTTDELSATVQKLRDAGVINYRVRQQSGSGK